MRVVKPLAPAGYLQAHAFDLGGHYPQPSGGTWTFTASPGLCET